jgi:hypothetical protein
MWGGVQVLQTFHGGEDPSRNLRNQVSVERPTYFSHALSFAWKLAIVTIFLNIAFVGVLVKG